MATMDLTWLEYGEKALILIWSVITVLRHVCGDALLDWQREASVWTCTCKDPALLHLHTDNLCGCVAVCLASVKYVVTVKVHQWSYSHIDLCIIVDRPLWIRIRDRTCLVILFILFYDCNLWYWIRFIVLKIVTICCTAQRSSARVFHVFHALWGLFSMPPV